MNVMKLAALTTILAATSCLKIETVYEIDPFEQTEESYILRETTKDSSDVTIGLYNETNELILTIDSLWILQDEKLLKICIPETFTVNHHDQKSLMSKALSIKAHEILRESKGKIAQSKTVAVTLCKIYCAIEQNQFLLWDSMYDSAAKYAYCDAYIKSDDPDMRIEIKLKDPQRWYHIEKTNGFQPIVEKISFNPHVEGWGDEEFSW